MKNNDKRSYADVSTNFKNDNGENLQFESKYEILTRSPTSQKGAKKKSISIKKSEELFAAFRKVII